MNKIFNRVGSILLIVVILCSVIWLPKDRIWIIPITLIIGSICMITNYILIQLKFKRDIWIGFGKKSVDYGSLIFFTILIGFIYIIPTFIEGDYGKEGFLGIDNKLFCGIFYLIGVFVDYWNYPVIIGQNFIKINILDFSKETININRIIKYYNGIDKIIFKTNKKTVEILKIHIPINDSELNRFILYLEKLIDKTR